jgi:asparagine synthase (glutamine-hydrolysing)
MCGIAGFLGRFDPSALEVANAAQAHRGPDGSGVWIDASCGVGLGHRRLAIIDLSSTGAQPMASEDRSVVVAFNGEIYNFRELRLELERAGHRFRGSSDTEVLLELYRANGEAMLSRLNGIFALAIWDGTRKQMLLARDALGVKPLYVAELPRGIAFASEIGALLKLAPEARELDPDSLHRYLTFLWCPGSGTPLRNVRKLDPGAALVARDGRIERRWSWYRLPALRDDAPMLDRETAVDETARVLRAAVQRQLVSDVPVGAFLSGGLDSSAVVAFAREASPHMRCFTIEPAGGEEAGFADDLPFARRVAAHLDVPLDVVPIDAARMAGDLAGMVAQVGEPIADPAALNVLYISRLARAAGIKVLLSGAGGDDVFSGYRRHAALALAPLWTWLPRLLRRPLARGAQALDQRNSAFRRASRLMRGIDLDGDAGLVDRFSWTPEARLSALYSDEFRAQAARSVAAQPMLDFLGEVRRAEPLERMLALEQRFFLADHNLNYTDKMSMAAGVEVRVPFLDTDLVEHAARIPPHLKQRGLAGKWVLKKAMEPHLPRDVIHRPKTGFGAPVRRWMRHDLRPMLDDLLCPETLSKRRLFDPAAVRRLIEDNDSGRVDASYTLLSVACIELWCRAFLDRNATAPDAASVAPMLS